MAEIRCAHCWRLFPTVRATSLHSKLKHPELYTSVKSTGLYHIWRTMMTRCSKKSHKSYHLYGGRGIMVCQEWRNFWNFVADMRPRPEGMTIERIDNDGPYSKSNCCWASMSVQMRNTRNNVYIAHAGLNLCLADWATELGISRASLWQRVQKYGAVRAVKLGVTMRPNYRRRDAARAQAGEK